jgi:hypothetical protein
VIKSEEYEVDGACRRNWKAREIHSRFEVKTLKVRACLEDLGVDWSIILKWILKT